MSAAIVELKVATANCEGFAPSLTGMQVTDCLVPLHGLGLDALGTQEMWDRLSHRRPLRRTFPYPAYRNTMPLFPWLAGISECLTLSNMKGWHVGARVIVRELSPKIPGQVDARQFVARRSHKAGQGFCFLNAHVLPRRVGRMDLYNLSIRRIQAFAAHELDAGRHVIITGDFNMGGHVLGDSLAGRPVQYVTHAPDHIIAIAARGFHFQLLNHGTQTNPSDHDAVWASWALFWD